MTAVTVEAAAVETAVAVPMEVVVVVAAMAAA